MNFYQELQLAPRFYWRTFRFIDKNRLWSFFLLPALLNLLLATGITYLAITTAGKLTHWAASQYGMVAVQLSHQSFFGGMFLLFLRIAVIFMFVKLYRYLILILFAPFMMRIAHRVQYINLGISTSNCSKPLHHLCGRSVRVAIHSFALDLLFTFTIILASLLITWILPLTPLIILLIESYFIGYTLIDYRNAVLELDEKTSDRLINDHRGLATGVGLFFNVGLLVPVVGIVFAPIFALIAAGLSINYIEKRKNLLCPSNPSILTMAKY
jgi:CysZ protein